MFDHSLNSQDLNSSEGLLDQNFFIVHLNTVPTKQMINFDPPSKVSIH